MLLLAMLILLMPAVSCADAGEIRVSVMLF